MSALIKACNFKASVKNTGVECDTAMTATYMLIALDPSVTFTNADMADPVTWLTNQIQLRKAFPMFGIKAPINEIDSNNGNDVTVTLDDGTMVFIRYDMYTRTFVTIKGGLCFAQALQSFNSSGYTYLELDQQGQMLCRLNSDGTFGGLNTTFQYGPSPKMADLKNPFKNRFQISYSPIEFVNNGYIFKNANALLGMIGLIDAVITKAAAAATITDVTIAVNTECAGTDLVAKFAATLANPANFIMTNKATGAVITISAAAVVSGAIKLSASLVSGQTYHVVGATPDVWQAHSVVGYDGNYSGGVDIAVP